MARTQTQAKPEQVTQVNKGGELTLIQQPRLPYHPELQTKYEIGIDEWRTLVDAIFPGATSVTSVVLALSYCKARNLDVFKRPVHIVPIYSKALNRKVDTIWPGIAEIRTTAARTKQYAGCDPAEWGPLKTKTWTVEGENENRELVKRDISVTFHEWCRITVYRIVGGVVCKFVGPEVKWEEVYATVSHTSDLPNEMWQTRSEGQHEKCAEAAALRRAFPEEVGNELIGDEIGHGNVDVGNINSDRVAHPDRTLNMTATEVKQSDQQKGNGHDQQTSDEAFVAWSAGLQTRLQNCTNAAEVFELRKTYVDGFKEKLTLQQLDEAKKLIDARLESFSTIQDTSNDEPPV